MATVYAAYFNTARFSILPTEYIYMFHMILIPNNQLVFEIEMHCMFCVVRSHPFDG
jgi:hypothetical protein